MGRGIVLSLAALGLALTPLAPARASTPDTPLAFDIAAQPLDAALLAFARQSGVQVISASAALSDKRTSALHAVSTPRAALRAMLKDSGLTAIWNANTATITLAPPANDTIATHPISLPLAPGLPGAETAPTTLGEVVVTGSRLIQASRFATPTPVTIVTEQQIELRAQTSVAEAVNELPSVRQTITTTQNQRQNGNGGQNRVDLRGLGPARTLILMNGRRFVPTNTDGTVDVNLVPTSLVSRVEVVTGGASAAYGSDAVAGVVNFILKDHVDGLRGTVQYGRSEAGDNIEPALSLSAGTTLADGRLHLMAGADWSDNHGVGTLYGRDWGRMQPGVISFGSLATRGGLPAQGLATNVTYSAQTAGGVIVSGPLKGTAFGPGGAPYALQYGQVFSNLMIGGSNTPDANPFGNWKLEAPYARYTGLGRLTYDLTDSLKAFLEYGYGHQESAGLSSYHQSASLVVPISNPFIPDSIRAAMVAGGLPSITVGRYDTELGGYKLFNWNTSQRIAGGLSGHLAGNWSWDLAIQHGETVGHAIVSTNIIEANYLAATYVVAGPDGSPVCGPVASNPNLTTVRAAQVQAGCQPFNIFGRNSPSQAALNYIRGVSDTATTYRQDTVAANVRGEPFSTPAGPVRLATGLESRQEATTSLANSLGQSLAFLSNNGSTFSGSEVVSEGYVEAGVPLVKNAPWAKTLGFDGAVRQTNYSTSGWATTWKGGLTWEIGDHLLLRAARSRDIRAPNLTELFQSPTRGIMATFANPINNQTGVLFNLVTGNPDLKPEVADALTVGGVIKAAPTAASAFSVSLDYYDIDVARVITTLAPSDIANRCAKGFTSYCSMITFDGSPFGISLISSIPANLNHLHAEGFDLEADYAADLDIPSAPGRLELRALTTFVRSLKITDPTASIERAGSGANGGVPGVTGSVTLSYATGPVTNSLMVRYTSAISGDSALIGPGDSGYSPSLPNSISNNHFPAAAYLNWSGQYDFSRRGGRPVQLFAVVNNLLNGAPPPTAIVAFASGGNPYDVIGRTYRLGVRFRF